MADQIFEGVSITFLSGHINGRVHDHGQPIDDIASHVESGIVDIVVEL